MSLITFILNIYIYISLAFYISVLTIDAILYFTGEVYTVLSLVAGKEPTKKEMGSKYWPFIYVFALIIVSIIWVIALPIIIKTLNKIPENISQ